MKLILYKECKIRKNDVIEKTTNYDILTYLDTLEKEEVVNLNLNKRIFSDLTVNIKLNRQLKAIDVYSYNYAMIENDSSERYFYFIADKERVADSTTNLRLLLDTCNTYEYKNTIISDTSKYRRCNVIREHRDRFTSAKLPIIDKIDEGFGTLPMEVTETKLIGNSDKYYLGYYTSKGANSKTVCKVLKKDGEDHTKVWYNLFDSIGDILTADGQAALIYTDINSTFLDLNADPKDYQSDEFWDNKNLNFMYIQRTPTEVVIRYGFWVSGNAVYLQHDYTTKISQILDLYADKPIKILKGKYQQLRYDLNKSYFLYDILGTYTSDIITKTAGLNYIIPAFTDTLKADSNILKIIEVPYFQQLDIYPYYDFSLGAVIGATNNINQYSMSFSSTDMYSVSLPSSLENQLADKKFETKLLGSQFTTNMFKYDSFSYSIAAEDMTLPQTAFDINVHIPIDMSTTVAFEFDWKGTTHNEFDRWLITQRNNQVPTMTNAYLEYMQNGYNYDVKNRNIQTALNWASWGTGAAITAATGGLTVGKILGGIKDARSLAHTDYDIDTLSFGGYSAALGYRDETVKGYERRATDDYLKKGGAYSIINVGRDATSVATGLASNIVQTVQSKQALEKRKKDYLNSSENISNSDDVTLFNTYNGGNKLRYSKYKPREDIVNNVSNVLRICGYATNQEKIPVLNTRWFYNYLQADVEYKGGMYIPNLMLGDIQNSIAEGITLFHYKKGFGYDLDRKYENWENVLSGGSPSPEPGPEPTPGELKDLIVTGDTVLRDDGYFYYVSYQITNPNNFEVLFTGLFKEDNTTILSDFTMKAGETIGDKLEVDGKNLTLVGKLSKKEN